jgi:hypothetical protein
MQLPQVDEGAKPDVTVNTSKTITLITTIRPVQLSGQERHSSDCQVPRSHRARAQGVRAPTHFAHSNSAAGFYSCAFLSEPCLLPTSSWNQCFVWLSVSLFCLCVCCTRTVRVRVRMRVRVRVRVRVRMSVCCDFCYG